MYGAVWDTANHRSAGNLITILGKKAFIRSRHTVSDGDIIIDGPVQYRITAIHKYPTHKEAELEPYETTAPQ